MKFIKGTILVLTVLLSGSLFAQDKKVEKPATNFEDALKYPRTENSMPGKFPGKVVQVNHANCVKENVIRYDAAYNMLAKGMLQLTGAETLSDAWKMFVDENDRIGLKVNPVAGPILTTSVEVTQAIVKQLEEAGIPQKNIIIWDRREEQLEEAGFTKEAFPGITIIGTERLGKNGTMYDDEGNLYSLKMIDKDWYYWADYEEEYDDETMPYMVNSGKYSYFTKIVTQMVDKIINVPILKNAGSSITFCLKNLAYGSITNTGRLHKYLWSETTAQVNSFPPLRDKVVLNIGDGIKGCFNGGPGANPQFFCNYNTLLIGTDPVAVDRIGFEIVSQKRIEENLQKEANPRGMRYMEMSQEYGLGIFDMDKIDLQLIEME